MPLALETLPIDCAHAAATPRPTIVSCGLGLFGKRPHVALCRVCRQRKPTGAPRQITAPHRAARPPLALEPLIQARHTACQRCTHRRGLMLKTQDKSVYQVHCAIQGAGAISLADGSCPAGKWPMAIHSSVGSNGQQRATTQKYSGRRHLALKCHLSPGDVVMLTAAVRDLHRAHQNQFVTYVETSASDLWENNPYITPLDRSEPNVRTIEMHYPLVNQSNQRPVHFLRGYTEYLESQLGLRIPTTDFRGDIHLSDAEKNWTSQVEEQFGLKGPFWLLVAGGKYDFTAKWWPPEFYQAVVDHFRGRVHFVQCGEAAHWHPSLKGVFNLVGKTSLRQLVRLVYHAAGVICPVTLAMHLAAATPIKTNRLRPCVVLAGGREPPHWEAYPGHQFLHTIGMLPCCAAGGCWRSRCQKVGDHDMKDSQNLCERPVSVRDDLVIPQCMVMVKPERVIAAVEGYLAFSN